MPFVASAHPYHQPSDFHFRISCKPPEGGLLCRPGFYGLAPMVSRASFYTMEQRGAPRFLGSPSHAFALLKRPRPRRSAMPLRQSGVAPADQTAKAATISISRLIHTASAFAVYASKLQFPYTGKTRFRRVANPYRVGLKPTGLQWRISSRLASLSIPTPQA
jgi:hypothetical protein